MGNDIWVNLGKYAYTNSDRGAVTFGVARCETLLGVWALVFSMPFSHKFAESLCFPPFQEFSETGDRPEGLWDGVRRLQGFHAVKNHETPEQCMGGLAVAE